MCPLICELGIDYQNTALYNAISKGPCFGSGYDICIQDKCNKEIKGTTLVDNYCFQASFKVDLPSGTSLCGGDCHEGDEFDGNDYIFKVLDYQVFQLKS